MSSLTDLYATAENFGGDITPKRPWVKTVTVPETIKRRTPSKHYVFKIVVQWSNGTSTVVYRRYSMFFDFLFKLQELYSQVNPKLQETFPQLPELRGRVFGRSQVHQVAEKRRKKIEEFCQQLIRLPPQISESNLVLGFFNTWSDDTMQHQTEPPASSSAFAAAATSAAQPVPTTSPGVSPPPITTPSSTSFQGSETTAVISHPDEMEHLEQYRALVDYERKDSHQVNLTRGQIVHVIEKCDTGWWMVMSEDEQGYAAACYLEPQEGETAVEEADSHPEDHVCEVYEAMETYSADPNNDDEVSFKSGDKIEVLTKSMDGWWKIRCNGKVGMCPSALIRRKTKQTSDDFIYESEKSIYEELNIHKPPPRRNTIDRAILNSVKPRPIPKGYDSPRSNPVLASKQSSKDIYIDPLESDSGGEEGSHYKIPKTAKVAPVKESNGPKVNGMTPGSKGGSTAFNGGRKLGSTSSLSSASQGSLCGPLSPLSEQEASIYENAEVSLNQYQKSPPPPSSSQPHPPPTSPSSHSETNGTLQPQHNDDDSHIYEPDTSIYEDTDVGMGPYTSSSPSTRTQPTPPPLPSHPPSRHPLKSASSAGSLVLPSHAPDDYEDLDMDDVIGGSQSKPSQNTLPSAEIDDYVEMNMDVHNTYIDPVELGPQMSSAASPAARVEPVFTKSILKKPGSPSKKVPSSSRPPLSKSKSLTLATLAEDEYIEMDSVYHTPPEEEEEDSEEPATPGRKASDQQLPTTPITPGAPATPLTQTTPTVPTTPITTSAGKSRQGRPLPPPPYAERPKIRSTSDSVLSRSPLSRARSMEDLLSSSPLEEDSFVPVPRQHSPPVRHRKFDAVDGPAPPLPSRVPILPPRDLPSGKNFIDGGGILGRGKPRPAKTKRSVGEKPPPRGVPVNRPTTPESESSNARSGRHGSSSAQPPTSPPQHDQVFSNRPASPQRERVQPLRPISPLHERALHNRTTSPVHSQSANTSSSQASDASNDASHTPKSPEIHKPLAHTISEPAFVDSNFPRTYVAVDSYSPQADGCLSFSAGDKCVLIQKTPNGWWLVNLGGREGWVPGEYWNEEIRKRVATVAKPPSVAPQRLPDMRKPRSHTVADPSSDLGSSLELSLDERSPGPPSLTGSQEFRALSPLSRSFDGHLPRDPSRHPDGVVFRDTRPTPPPIAAKPRLFNKAPAKPAPFQGPGQLSPHNPRRKPPPAVPHKPSRQSPRVSPSPSTSPPSQRKHSSTSPSSSPSPPPLPPGRRGLDIAHVTDPASSLVGGDEYGEYARLADSKTHIEAAPWFLGKMERAQAEQFLMECGRQREFLVRERTAKDGYYALSIRYHYSCKHFNIDPTTDGSYSMGTLTFPTIDEIIVHYQHNSLFIHDGQHVTLGQPVKKRTPKSSSFKSNVHNNC